MELDIREALRYLGVKGEPDRKLLETLAAVAKQVTETVRPRYVYRVFPVVIRGDEVALEVASEGAGMVPRGAMEGAGMVPRGAVEGAGMVLKGAMAGRMLADCGHAAVLLCTLGAAFDAMQRREQVRDAARGVMMDACGSAWVEAGCDAAQAEIAERFPDSYLTDRFSPGYGDFPLDVQPALCAALDAGRRLGVQVTESFLMNPMKSVTAVIGLSDKPQPARIRGCGVCAMRETCAFRKEGTTCGI